MFALSGKARRRFNQIMVPPLLKKMKYFLVKTAAAVI